MKFERRSREQSGQAVGALVGGLLVAFALPAAAWLHLGLPLPVCLFRESTGIPCPTCGEELEVNWRFCVACGTEVTS